MQAGSNAWLKPSAFAPSAVAVVVGLAAVAGQIALMREVIVLFNGNELSIGVFLAIWLALTAAGSSLAGRLAPKRASLPAVIAAVECLSAISLPLAIWILRDSRAWLQAVPGELLGPVPLALASLLSLSSFCIVSGSLFALAAQLVHEEAGIPQHLATSTAYLLETAGFALGGILTSLLLLRFFNSFQIAFVVALLNLWVASALLFKTRCAQFAMASTATAFTVALLLQFAPRIERSTQQRIWQNLHISGSEESIYGKLMVLQAGGLRSIYENGTILANIPDPAAAEETVHYALLEHPDPARVLLIGGGINGSITEALKHPGIARLDYVELDPALIGICRRFFPAEAARAFSDPRVHVHNTDGRLYLKLSHRFFDAVILSLPNPENAQLNRFYTAQFFQTVRDHLAPGGLLALQLHAAEDYIGPALADFLRCIHHTLRSVFPNVVVIPGSTLHMFAAVQRGVLTDDPQELMARLRSRNIQTQYVREYFLPFRMMPDRMAQIQDLLRPLPATATNRDFDPVAYYFAVVLWGAQFKSDYASLLQDAANIPFSKLLAILTALSLFLVLLFALLPKRRIRYAAEWSVVATGFALMALQLLVLLAFQAICGYLYYNLALLIGMFMAGIALGSLLGILRVRRGNQKLLLRSSAINQLLLAVSAPLFLYFATLLAQISAVAGSIPLTQLAFSVLAIFCGIPGGSQFPIASAIYQSNPAARASTGTLYALDLMGGCAGALLLAAFLIPLFGFWNTAWTIAAICVTPAIVTALVCFNSVPDAA